jgi:hypothetical protein
VGEILQYISAHWISWVFAVISALLGAANRQLYRQMKAQRSKTQAINEGVLALLHDRLYQACQYYINKGSCSIDDRDNLEYMFRPYKALGGNGTGEELYNRCLALPYGPEKED